jgi:hypothetical protein
MATTRVQKLMDNVSALKADLKDANAELKLEIEGTPMYKAFFDAIKETTENVPDKTAAANAFKLTLAMFTKKEEEDS